MELYSVLLADDEEEVLEIIMRKMDWEGMGFRVCGYARNGVEALEMAEEMQPDVVMTDIRMPYMDGLELSRELKQRDPDIRVIIFSGFDEFEYAKEAIRIEVEQYLLKPIDTEELTEVFQRLRKSLDEERDTRRNLLQLREYYMQSLPALQENFTLSMIEGRVPPEKLEQYLRSYKMDLDGPYYVAAVLHVSGAPEPDGMDGLVFTLSVRHLVEEQLRERYRIKTVNYLGDLAVIAQLMDPGELTEFTDALDLLCRQAKRMFEVKVTAGVGTVTDTLREIRKSYKGAMNAVSYRAIYGNTRAISISEVDPAGGAEDHWEQRSAAALAAHIRSGDLEALNWETEQCLRRFRQEGLGIARYRSFVMAVSSELIGLVSEYGLDIPDFTERQEALYRRFFESESPEDTAEWIRRSGYEICRLMQEKREFAATSFVGRAQDYVKEHFADTDITIESVCHTLGVSSAYFSTVFKKETGKTFIAYLTEYRMERAVELLLGTADKTYMIADKVGYTDSNYFSYVFKKQYGLSPSRFRAARRKQMETGAAGRDE